MLAMVTITIGEMVITPIAQAYVGEAAPEGLRGRYSGVMGFSWTIGLLKGGLIMDNGNSKLNWYGSAIFSTIDAAGFFWLRKSHNKGWAPVQRGAGSETG